MSKRLQGFLLVATDGEQLRQPENGENMPKVAVDAAQHESAATGAHLVVHGHECTQQRGAQSLDGAEVEHKMPALRLLHQTVQLFADFLDKVLVENDRLVKFDDSDVADVFLSQETSINRCDHGSSAFRLCSQLALESIVCETVSLCLKNRMFL